MNSGTDQPGPALVQIRAGCQHPSLGAIGGWEGTVLRSFTVDGVPYLDVEVSAKTIGSIAAPEKARYYQGKIVFTRLRLARKDAQTIPAPALQITRGDVTAGVQHEWFTQVGARQQDPTQFVADRAAGGGSRVDAGRREAIRSLVGFGLVLMFMLALMEKDCSCGNSGTGGSWGRSGGFSS